MRIILLLQGSLFRYRRQRRVCVYLLKTQSTTKSPSNFSQKFGVWLVFIFAIFKILCWHLQLPPRLWETEKKIIIIMNETSAAVPYRPIRISDLTCITGQKCKKRTEPLIVRNSLDCMWTKVAFYMVIYWFISISILLMNLRNWKDKLNV